MDPEIIARFAAAVGEKNCIREPEQLRTYESDGLASFRATPGIVVLPASTEEVSACVKIAREAGMPIVARGAGARRPRRALPVAVLLPSGVPTLKQVPVAGPRQRVP